MAQLHEPLHVPLLPPLALASAFTNASFRAAFLSCKPGCVVLAAASPVIFYRDILPFAERTARVAQLPQSGEVGLQRRRVARRGHFTPSPLLDTRYATGLQYEQSLTASVLYVSLLQASWTCESCASARGFLVRKILSSKRIASRR